MPPLWKKTRRSPRSGNRRSRARRRPSRSRQRQMARSASGVRTTTWSIAGASAAAASAGRAPSCTARPWKASGQPAGRSPRKRIECTPGSPDSSSTAPHPSWKRRTSPASRTGSTPRRSVYAAVASSRSGAPIWMLSSSTPEALPHLASEGRGVRRKERVQLRAERGGAPDPGDGAPLRPRPPAAGSPRPRARPRRAGRAGGRVRGARPRRGRRSRRRGRPGARRLREVPRPRGAGGRGPGGGRGARRRRPGASDARRGRARGAHRGAAARARTPRRRDRGRRGTPRRARRAARRRAPLGGGRCGRRRRRVPRRAGLRGTRGVWAHPDRSVRARGGGRRAPRLRPCADRRDARGAARARPRPRTHADVRRRAAGRRRARRAPVRHALGARARGGFRARAGRPMTGRLRTLLARRASRARWGYVPALPALAFFTALGRDEGIPTVLYLMSLVVVCLRQLFRPRLLGWALLFVLFVLSTVSTLYTAAFYASHGVPIDRRQYVLLLACGGVPSATLLRARPSTQR